MYELSVEAQFDSAHNLRCYNGPCENLHGHTYRVQVYCKGSELNELGVLVDFRRLKSALGKLIARLDHTYLNDLPEFQDVNPTAEHLAKLIFTEMRQAIGHSITKATVWETPTSSASYWEEPEILA